MKSLLFSCVLGLIPINLLFGQVKYEREYTLDKTEVPTPALDFVNALGFTKKIKWYKEEGLNQTSVEAKTKHLSKRYSIEFDNDGKLEDIEVEVKFQEIPLNTKNTINNYFKSNFQKAKIYKTQIQYSGKETSLIKAVQDQRFEEKKEIVIRYELVAKVANNKEYQKMEFLFDAEGKLLHKAVILLKNTDNLEY